MLWRTIFARAPARSTSSAAFSSVTATTGRPAESTQLPAVREVPRRDTRSVPMLVAGCAEYRDPRSSGCRGLARHGACDHRSSEEESADGRQPCHSPDDPSSCVPHAWLPNPNNTV
ncbi:hypothetical protein SVIOM74S_00771 [Streptomyces violarus]